MLPGCQTLQKNDATYLDVDVCGVIPDDTAKCHAVPLNESGLEYDRPVMAGDMCVRLDEFAILQKHFNETLRKCGDRCK
jgi:hypothetical protein